MMLSDETKTIYGSFALKVRKFSLVAHTSTPKTATFQKREITIGSHPDCDFVVDDPSISRRHASIVIDETGFRLVDSKSKNGTYIGDLRVNDIYLTSHTTFRCAGIPIDFEILNADAVQVDIATEDHFGNMLGSSVAMREIFGTLARVAPTLATVLIQGENGSGKELVASAIHSHSERANKPYVIFDCSAVSKELIESELFGHLKGSFTGAVSNRDGAFRQANGGTIFLDEIGELPLDLQPKLLRVLENRTIRPVGSEKAYPVDVRVIAATNRNLAHEVEQGNFREDLFYRLSVININVPPLRDRIEDIPMLVEHFLNQFAERQNTAPKHVNYSTLQKLKSHSWPGNVRELRNFVERACVLSNDNRIETRFLNVQAIKQVEKQPTQSQDNDKLLAEILERKLPFRDAKSLVVEAFERSYWTAVIKLCKGNISAASRFASINRKSVEYILEKYDDIRDIVASAKDKDSDA